MIDVGKFNKLKVLAKENPGCFLQGDEKWGEILLPTKHAPKNLEVGDEVDVFVYFDSEDRIIATTQTPYATVGEFASLEVSSVEEVGVFLDWGLDKDLFVPFREKLFEMKPGESYAVYIYIDSSNRIAATTRLSKHIDKSFPPFGEGEKVALMPYQTTHLGINAIVNGSHSGLIYKSDILNKMELGQKIPGYIRKIREDGKIDLSLQPEGLEGREDLAEIILEKLKESGGTLEVTAKTPAETINTMFNVSRKKFKIALGFLYKKQLITIDENSISLK